MLRMRWHFLRFEILIVFSDERHNLQMISLTGCRRGLRSSQQRFRNALSDVKHVQDRLRLF
jgi:hypothetical protein